MRKEWFLRAACLVSSLLSAGNRGLQAEPTIGNLGNHAVQRGTEGIIHFYGGDLLDPQDVLFYDPAVQLLELFAYSTNHVAARVRVAPDCPPGMQAFRLCTGRGISNLRQFGVTALPIVDESEPNNSLDTAQSLRPPFSYRATLTSEDIDCVSVELSEGEIVSLEVEGLRLGQELVDPVLTVFDPDQQVVVEADDHVVTRQDPFCSFTAAKAGRYIIQVREATYRGNDRFLYLLHVGRFPRPSYGTPSGGRPGESLDVTWHADDGSTWSQSVTMPLVESPYHHEAPSFAVYPENTRGIAPTPLLMRILDLPRSSESEPNDAIATASPMSAPGIVEGVMAEGENDIFRFAAKKGQPLEIEVFARRALRSRLDAVLSIRNGKNQQLVANDDNAGNRDSFVDFNPPEDGDYFAFVRDHLRHGGAEYLYRLEITPRTPRMVLRAPDRRPFVPTTARLPRGGRMAVLLVVSKQHFDAPVSLSFNNLPPGIAVEAPTIPAGRDRVPVVLTVAEDAATQGHFVIPHGVAQVGAREIHAPFHQRTILVRGENNRDVWGHDADRLAVAVTDAAPYSVDIVQPSVPIVRNGSMQLRVVASRNEGFTAPITVRMVYNPPGVYSVGSATIAKDASETTMSLTANGNAPIGSSPIAVTADTQANAIAYEVSSQVAELRVEDPFFEVELAKANVEQGGQTEFLVSVKRTREFEGNVRAELVGLPAGTSAMPLEVAADQSELRFQVRADKKARVGRFNTVLCRLVIEQRGESITHTLGTGQLRVDKPLPPPHTNDDDPAKASEKDVAARERVEPEP